MRKILYFGILLFFSACRPVEVESGGEMIPPTETPLSTPLPAQPTITLPPAFTSTPVPLYFREDFNTDLSAWVSFQTGGESAPGVRLENDLLRLDFSTPDTWYSLIHNAHEYKRVFISAKIYTNAAGSVGLICNYSEDGWIEYNLTRDGTYSVLFGRMLGDGIAQYTPIESDGSEYLKRGLLDYESALACDDGFIYLYIDGKLFRKIDVSRFELASGRVGLAMSSYGEVPMIATVDWFQVGEPQ